MYIFLYIPTGIHLYTYIYLFFLPQTSTIHVRWIYNRPMDPMEIYGTFPHGRTLRSWWPRRLELTDIFLVSSGGMILAVKNGDLKQNLSVSIHIYIILCICIVDICFSIHLYIYIYIFNIINVYLHSLFVFLFFCCGKSHGKPYPGQISWPENLVTFLPKTCAAFISQNPGDLDGLTWLIAPNYHPQHVFGYPFF